tara:strand:+ start:23060 stop:23830 length:771 start_codon:yes stop_codon:yes gene_type:complete
MPKGIKTSAGPLSEAQQSLLLIQLMDDFSHLNKMIAECVTNDKTKAEIEKVQLELAAFKQILQNDAEYSADQIKKLCQQIESFSQELKTSHTVEGIMNVVNRHFASLNNGKSPIKALEVEMELDEGFQQNMQNIDAQCEKINDHLKKLKNHSPGRHHNLIEKLSNACQNAMSAIHSVFQSGLWVAKEAKYYVTRLAIVSGLKEESLEERAVYSRRKAVHWQQQAEKHAQQVGDMERGKAMRENEENPKESKIFKKK